MRHCTLGRLILAGTVPVTNRLPIRHHIHRAPGNSARNPLHFRSFFATRPALHLELADQLADLEIQWRNLKDQELEEELVESVRIAIWEGKSSSMFPPSESTVSVIH